MKIFRLVLSVSLVLSALALHAQNGFRFRLTYNNTTQEYTALAVPNYNLTMAGEVSTSQLVVKVDSSFKITSRTDIKGIWSPGTYKGSLVGNPTQNIIAFGLVSTISNFPVVANSPVALFSFKGTGCKSSVKLIDGNDADVKAWASGAFSIGLAPSIYERSMAEIEAYIGNDPQYEVPCPSTFSNINNADLSLRKVLLTDCQRAIGDEVTVQLILKRQDNLADTLGGIVVKDSISNQFTIVDAVSNKGAFNPATGLWSGLKLAAGDSAILNIRLKVMGAAGFVGGLICSYAEIVAMGGTDRDSSPNNKSETEDDNARICVSVPIELCTAQGERIELTAPAGYASYAWSLNGVPIPQANTRVYLASAAGNYTVKVNLTSCIAEGCCPIVVTEKCPVCPPATCIPFLVQRTKK